MVRNQNRRKAWRRAPLVRIGLAAALSITALPVNAPAGSFAVMSYNVKGIPPPGKRPGHLFRLTLRKGPCYIWRPKIAFLRSMMHG